ncbi:MAG: hypothetical protein LGR52_09350 [Candidatus Thiosymbion ectosymbiont of Robbea hypermnestra]|nr:hypothetical protein [Candidatus Thiosymbion ectosymbiont of Robbea hypermnestra]
MSKTFTPTVLLVDADPAMLDILSRRFYDNTSLGVLAFGSLVGARSAILNENIDVDAVLSDIAFPPQTQDPTHDLYDGMDLMQFVSEHRPNLPNYVYSVYGRESTYQGRGKGSGLELEKWFPKLEIDRVKPWNQIERDLYKAALLTDKELTDKAKNEGLSQNCDGDSLVDWIRSSIRPARQTYLQRLPKPYQILAPIRVICEENDSSGLISAEAPGLGIILPGQGESVEDALDDLANIVVEQFEDFLDTGEGCIVGYAAIVFEKLKACVAKTTNV